MSIKIDNMILEKNQPHFIIMVKFSYRTRTVSIVLFVFCLPWEMSLMRI